MIKDLLSCKSRTLGIFLAMRKLSYISGHEAVSLQLRNKTAFSFMGDVRIKRSATALARAEKLSNLRDMMPTHIMLCGR